MKIAKDFDEAYRAGKFAEAVTLFTNLGGVITQIAGDLNVTNHRIVKLALVSIAVGPIAIASLLKSQADNLPAVKSLVQAMRSNASKADEEGLKQIEALAAVDVNKLLTALQ